MPQTLVEEIEKKKQKTSHTDNIWMLWTYSYDIVWHKHLSNQNVFYLKS